MISDPESLKQIKELADMLSAEANGSGADEGCKTAGVGEEKSDPDGCGASDGGGLDLDTILRLMQIVSGAGDDKDRRLLVALKPHLSTDKQERVDRAVKMLKLYSMVTAIKDSGMLGSLDKLL